MGRINLAVSDYSKAIELDPHFVYAYKARSGVWLAKGDYQKYVADMSHVCDLSENTAERQAACSIVSRAPFVFGRKTH
jgi:tetratricopeptide (TPR) repeat protein